MKCFANRSLLAWAVAFLFSTAVTAPAARANDAVVAIATAYVEEFLGKGDTATADRVLSPDIEVTTGLSPQGPIKGLETYKAAFKEFQAAFPLVEPLVIVDAFATADRAVIRFQARTTHTADYFGVKATNRPILFDETHVMRIRDGKVVENVVSATNLEFEMLMAPALTPLILK